MIELIHGTAGTLTLPSPARNSSIALQPHQGVNRTPAGVQHAFQQRSTDFRYQRTFESLSDAELYDLWIWLEAIGWFAGTFAYRFTDPRGNKPEKELTGVRIVKPPSIKRLSLNINDLVLEFEGDTLPDFDSAATVP